MKPKCPICGGPPNRMYFSHIEQKPKNEYAIFIVECWSGNTSITSKHHHYKAKIKILDSTEVNQLKEMENQNKELIKTLDQFESDIFELQEAMKDLKKID